MMAIAFRNVMIALLFAVALVPMAFATGTSFTDPCYEGSISSVSIGFVPDAGPGESINGTLEISNTCEGGTSIEWVGTVEISLGNITDDQVVISSTSIYVDSVARPDLDVPAVLVFKSVPFAVRPHVLVDGLLCDSGLGCENETWNGNTRTFSVAVDGFSNYSLQGRQDFDVYSDPEPELRDRVYQTIDLNDSNRNTQFKCVVQIYGENQLGEYVLVQTNPERKVAARLWGSPDANNPESLGYFPTENGLANVYFNGKTLTGYLDLEYVVMCASNTTSLVYEEPLSTRYIPAGRSIVGRGVWFTSDSNAFFLIIAVVGGVLLLWVLVNAYRRSFR